jgi:hypothetical protein
MRTHDEAVDSWERLLRERGHCITPGAGRKTYDVVVHSFPVGRHRRLRTFERTGVQAGDLGTLLADAGTSSDQWLQRSVRPE